MDNQITQFLGGPCDGLSTSDDYEGEPMVVMQGCSVLHLYEKISPNKYEHWGTFPDPHGQQESVEFEVSESYDLGEPEY